MTDKEIRKWYRRNKRREKSFDAKWKAVADGLSNTPYIPKILKIYSPDGVV